MFGGLALRKDQLFVTHGFGRGYVSVLDSASLKTKVCFAVRDERRRPFAPAGIGLGPTFAIHVCDPRGGAVRRYSVFGRSQGRVGGSPPVRSSAAFARPGTGVSQDREIFPASDRRGLLAEPCAVDVDERGNLYVASAGGPRVNAVQKFTLDGRFLGSFRAFGCPGETFNGPHGVLLSKQFVYIADTGNGAVHVFQRGGSFRQVFSTASGHGDRSRPVAIALEEGDGLLVLERGSSQELRRFTRSGEFVEPRLENATIVNPVAVARGDNGFVYILDLDGARLRAFDLHEVLIAERDLSLETATPVKLDGSLQENGEPPESEVAT